MTYRRLGWLGLPFTSIAMLAAFAHAGNADGRAANARGDELQCLECVYLDGMHAFVTGMPELCVGENCEQNNCRACGGTSECHEDPQSGSCHVRCECSPQDNEQALALLRQVEQSLESHDVEGLAALIARHQDLVAFNRERNALQVHACGAVVRHVPLSGATVSRLDLALLSGH